MDPLHVELYEYECARRILGDAAMEAAGAPEIEWPEEWGSWSLVRHRIEIATDYRERERIAAEEAAQRRGS